MQIDPSDVPLESVTKDMRARAKTINFATIYGQGPHALSQQLKITHADPAVRGDTATNVTKPVTLETGATIGVPLFIKEGEVIRIDSRSGEYVERVS